MRLMEMLQEGGWGAYLALLVGGLASLLGVLALVLAMAKSRAGFGLAIATLLLGAVAAGVGVFGQLDGQRRTDEALAMVGNAVDVERIHRAGFRESQNAGLVGSLASLAPLLLGAIAALLTARLRTGSQRPQGEVVSSSDEGSARIVMALGFTGLCALGTAGAWVLSHRALPTGTYALDEQDSNGWALASALEELHQRATPEACERLEAALMPYWTAADRRQWPRVMEAIPSTLGGWRKQADRCAAERLDDQTAATSRTLLSSVLLQDAELRARAQATVDRTEQAEQAPQAPPPGAIDVPGRGLPIEGEPVVMGAVDPRVIKKIVHANRGQLRYCYESAAAKQPTLAGMVEVKFIISSNGSVQAANISQSTLQSADLEACLVARVRTWTFPGPKGGGVAIIVLPLQFGAKPD